MRALLNLLLLRACVCAALHPPPPAAPRHPHPAHYEPEYEPFLYAAIPLHDPVQVPIMHVLSRAPLSRERTRAPSAHHPVYTQPPYHQQQQQPRDYEYPRHTYRDSEYASAHNQYEYQYQYGYGHAAQEFPATRAAHKYKYSQYHALPTDAHPHTDTDADADIAQDEPTILYARPNPQGGFSYRRNPLKSVPQQSLRWQSPSPISTTEAPVIIRVHRYKVVRDR